MRSGENLGLIKCAISSDRDSKPTFRKLAEEDSVRRPETKFKNRDKVKRGHRTNLMAPAATLGPNH